MDSFVGTANADTFNGYINTTVGNTTSTLTAADVITGGAGVDTLAITVEGAAAGALPNSTITGVEKFSIRDVSSNAAASVYDFAAIQGETEVTANSSSHAVSFTNLATGTVVGVKGDGVNTTGAVTFSMAKGTDAVALALNGVKGSSVAATVAGKATSATITTAGAASTTGTITLSDETTGASAGATIKDVTINANADLTIGAAGGGADLIGFDVTTGVTNTITVTGSASKVVLNDVAAAVDVIDASAFTGGVTANASMATLSSFKGGVGADNLTVGALTAAGTVALGAGDDVFNAAAGVVKSTNSIDGGAGIDTFGLKAVDASNLGQFSNFEIANVDSLAAGSTYDLALLASKNSITKLTVGTAASAVAATVEKIAAGVGLDVVGDKAVSGLVLKVANAATGASDSFGINFNVAADAAGAVLTPNLSATINDVETINIVSGGGALNTNSFTLTSAANSLSSITNKVTQTINVSGADQLTLNVAGSVVDKVVVDGSAATGKLLVTGGVSTTVIKGGSADDTITLANTATTITTGAGKDVVNVTAAKGGTNITSITDFAKGDSLTTVSGAAAGVKVGAATSLAGATDVATILSTLATAAKTAASEFAWAAVGTDVYAVAGTDNTLVGDNVIKLSGVSDLSSWTFDGAGKVTAA